MAKKTFTDNEAISLMHKNTSIAFRKIADHIEKHELDYKETVDYMRDIADELEAQIIVVDLRDAKILKVK